MVAARTPQKTADDTIISGYIEANVQERPSVTRASTREQAAISSSITNIDELAECHGSESSRDRSDFGRKRAHAYGEILRT